jgi:hypothetical protein
MANNLCFVLMPFGRKKDAAGREINFDAVWEQVIKPAVAAAKLEPIRADQELIGGIIHKPMFERLILCDYAVADLTAWNPNVMYELGVRHAVRPWRTVAMFNKSTGLPFDVAMLRALPYEINDEGAPKDPEGARVMLCERLEAARKEAAEPTVDSPVYQLVEFQVRAQVDHTKTDTFRDQVRYSEEARRKLAEARKRGKKDGPAAVAAVQAELRPLTELETGVIIDLLLSYRDVSDWNGMIALVEKMPLEVRQTMMVQEQYGLALNRAGRGDHAIAVLQAVAAEHGARSETMGILGRVYKDQWEAAFKANDTLRARGLIQKAIDIYARGFEADWRDAYPGVNAVTLMELREPPDPRRLELLPVVDFAVRRKIAGGTADYWDWATLLELAILRKLQPAADEAAANALATNPASWMAETTVRNLRLIREARQRRNEPRLEWVEQIEQALIKGAS